MFIVIVIILLHILVNFIFASLMDTVAEDKGYENLNTFILVLLFGVIGILYVISLPDLTARQQREDILNVLLNIQQQEDKEINGDS